MAFVSSAHHTFSRFDLPGFNLPLNFTPNAPWVRSVIPRSGTKGKPEEILTEVPARSEGRDLFINALNARPDICSKVIVK